MVLMYCALVLTSPSGNVGTLQENASSNMLADCSLALEPSGIVELDKWLIGHNPISELNDDYHAINDAIDMV